ncbi:hypothetical protein [Intestinimonas sp.]|uniref:hypothetical protein n=1 Tax=Intestinimonas sp. TaxID=1965293 RepID=UPI002625F23F|nr:hypothetical protein [Intestinimonas sp.]
MGKLWGRQQKFDKNGDGRLGSGEWRNWYLSTFGHDMEMAERKKVSQMEANWEDWLNGAAQVVRNAANIFLESAGMLLPPNSKKLAWQTLLYQMMAGLVEGNQWNISEHTNTNMFVGNRVFYPYRALAFDLAKISGQCSEHELEKAILRGAPLFSDVGALTAEHCGSFWRQVIMQLPPYNEESEPEIQGGKLESLSYAPGFSSELQSGIENMVTSLFPLASFFAGATEDAADRRNTRFLNYFVLHWRTIQGVYDIPSFFPGISAKQLQVEFPSLREWNIEELSEECGPNHIEEMYRTNPRRTIELWRSLVSTTEPLTEPEQAEDYFYQLEEIWFSSEDDPELLRPILDALREEGFARQIFQSAYVNYFHQNIIHAARACGEDPLAEHCLSLLLQNPLPKEQWDLSEYDIEELCSAIKPRSVPDHTIHLPDDGTVFHYCTVRLQGVRRTYSYLTGALPLKVGDWVEVPFGKEKQPRCGQVASVTDCTRLAAPWPPEQTKTVLRIVKAPSGAEEAPDSCGTKSI